MKNSDKRFVYLVLLAVFGLFLLASMALNEAIEEASERIAHAIEQSGRQ